MIPMSRVGPEGNMQQAPAGHKQSFILDALPPIFSWTNADSSGSK